MNNDIEFRQIRYFVAVAEELNFTRAAKKLRIAQSLLSRQIQNLEKEIGIQLLDRTKRKISLTPAGITFFDECRQIIQAVEQAIQNTQKVAQGKIGRIVMGIESSTRHDIVLKIIRQFHQSYPGIELVLQEMSSGKQVKALREKKITVGLLDPVIATTDLKFQVLFSDPLVAVLPEKHPLANSETIDLEDLATDLWVTGPHDGSCGLLKRLLDICKQYGFTPQIRQEANDIPMKLSFIAAGFGVSLLPASSRTLATPGVKFIPLQDPVPEIQMAIAWLDKPEPSPLRESLLETIHSAVGLKQIGSTP
ncbi:transcriptional regulator, LysR family [[Leptolyngbya] sp. PCC 7376]|uniref:LysR family transcriptional regulator n=1 Tax=[Leptolyngbya] sp. PCC 7376 TaxID=111781 RepID=UPI00029F4466|nr:LysR family transcriptional regulator [[Leptolyngbya] sp. PCC 7376]AFY37057.1 transcriptional regulator, LysR family [[Leptolyngbya] sp. PCC 7376]